MLRALERGLSLGDFEELTFGMIAGYITTFNSEHVERADAENKGKGSVRTAGQEDFNKF